MDTFTVRIELHDPDDGDYDTLHDAMEAIGFSRTITGDDGIEYHLPHAEYIITSNYTAQRILNRAKKAARTTGCLHGVLVTESISISWFGLIPV